MGICSTNSNYYLDELVKYLCWGCEREFIISEYQAKQVGTNHIGCPYCHSDNIMAYVWMIDQEQLEELGCMGIGHYIDGRKDWVLEIVKKGKTKNA